ncbi:hypothetical protein [Butyricicoccus pullicaecorum]|uniref:hypothetical protein n=1 Tax=Butyricicoccus pullicaecorum TaxID=501571 RepID=UPI0013565F6C|nr:hypothetical protein [Butyricicoccus pullicaecorum]
MAILANVLQIAVVECDRRVIHVAPGEVDLVMDDLAWFSMAVLAQTAIDLDARRDIRAPAGKPGL